MPQEVTTNTTTTKKTPFFCKKKDIICYFTCYMSTDYWNWNKKKQPQWIWEIAFYISMNYLCLLFAVDYFLWNKWKEGATTTTVGKKT